MATPDEVHITVGNGQVIKHMDVREKARSVHFAGRIKPGDIVPPYLKKNPNFKFR